ncbi:hypothetical protein [Nonomuraea sp. NPDC050783]|uniref:hypothetical protein n=1 Tax=Nonomuraea sp. NPDC050783 TaxID=3154634 RepID=UPI0034665C8B
MTPPALSPSTARTWGPPIVAALVAGLLGLGSGYFGKAVISPPEPIPLADRMDNISVDHLASATVPHCAQLAGSAKQIDGYVPWLALRSVDTGEFYFAKPVRDAADPRTWRLSVTLGTAEPKAPDRFDLYAFYLSEPESRFIDGLAGFGNDGRPGYFSARTLPFGLPDKPATSITRGVDRGPACR